MPGGEKKGNLIALSVQINPFPMAFLSPGLSRVARPDCGLAIGAPQALSVNFTPNIPGQTKVVLGSFDEIPLVNGRWVPGRRLNGDETDHSRHWQNMRTFGIYRYPVFRRD
jgi:hypothetical protein